MILCGHDRAVEKHHIHHSADPRHHMANMGNIFSLWDRLFGTYIDPDTITNDLPFGIIRCA